MEAEPIIALLSDIENNAAIGEPDWDNISRRIKEVMLALRLAKGVTVTEAEVTPTLASSTPRKDDAAYAATLKLMSKSGRFTASDRATFAQIAAHLETPASATRSMNTAIPQEAKALLREKLIVRPHGTYHECHCLPRDVVE